MSTFQRHLRNAHPGITDDSERTDQDMSEMTATENGSGKDAEKLDGQPIGHVMDETDLVSIVLRDKYYLESKNFLYRDMKCGMNGLSHAAQLPLLNGRKCSRTFHESSNISLNISYLGYY